MQCALQCAKFYEFELIRASSAVNLAITEFLHIENVTSKTRYLLGFETTERLQDHQRVFLLLRNYVQHLRALLIQPHPYQEHQKSNPLGKGNFMKLFEDWLSLLRLVLLVDALCELL